MDQPDLDGYYSWFWNSFTVKTELISLYTDAVRDAPFQYFDNVPLTHPFHVIESCVQNFFLRICRTARGLQFNVDIRSIVLPMLSQRPLSSFWLSCTEFLFSPPDRIQTLKLQRHESERLITRVISSKTNCREGEIIKQKTRSGILSASIAYPLANFSTSVYHKANKICSSL